MSLTSRRLTTVALAAVGGLLGWAALRAAGAGLRADSTTVGPVDVVVAAVLAGSAAVATASLVARYAAHPQRTWALLSSTALSLSMLGPVYSAPALTAVALMGLHLLVGGVLIAGLAGTLPFRRSATEPQQDRVVVR